VLCLTAVLFQVWRANDMGGWDEEQTLHGHKDWVRDAVWAPNLGMPLNTIASAGQDGPVRGGGVRCCRCECEARVREEVGWKVLCGATSACPSMLWPAQDRMR
jgi:WD40 repeat protein